MGHYHDITSFRRRVQQFQLLVYYHILPENPKKVCRYSRDLPSAHLDAVRPSALPMAIGRKPLSVYMKSFNFAPKTKSPDSLGTFPSTIRFRSKERDLKKLTPHCVRHAFKVLKISWINLVLPALQSFGKDIIAPNYSKSLKKIY